MMTPEESIIIQENLFKDALEIIRKKRSDYSGDSDPFGNFRSSTLWGISPWRGAALRLMDKLARLKNLMSGKQAQVTDESIRDTVIDGINYLAIMYMLWLEQNEK